MNEKNQKTKVYILGAGCSANCGYPLANQFVSQLEVFGKGLGEEATRLKRCVEETANLMRASNVETVDDLAARLHAGAFDEQKGSPVLSYQQREQRIWNAKMAAVAMLLSKEAEAKKTGLHGYHNLLHEIGLGSANLQQKLKTCNCRVLTFNYDRLFEIAFLDRNGPDLGGYLLYGERWLNSGFNDPFGKGIEFGNGGFCFLKLHGSVGTSVNLRYVEPHYLSLLGEARLGMDVEIKDELFFANSSDDSPLRFQPLLVFPHEKQHVQAGGQHRVYDKYLHAVWNKARELVALADEIWVIGYSFRALDKRSIIELLSSAQRCEQVVVQNIGAEAQQICEELSLKHPELKFAWKSLCKQF